MRIRSWTLSWSVVLCSTNLFVGACSDASSKALTQECDAAAPSSGCPVPVADANAGADARFDDDAGEASPPPDARPFSIADPDFDSPGSGCGPFWGGTNVSLAHSTDAKVGASACRVCALGPAAELSSMPGFLSANPGEYFFGAYIKRSGPHPWLRMRVFATKNGVPYGASVGDTYALTPEYRPFGYRVVVPPDGDGLAFRIDIEPAQQGDCFLVDHFYLEPLP